MNNYAFYICYYYGYGPVLGPDGESTGKCAKNALIIMDLKSSMAKKQANVINVQMDAIILDVKMMHQIAPHVQVNASPHLLIIRIRR